MRNQRQGVRSIKPEETSPISGTSASAAPTPVDDEYIAAVGLNRRKISPIRGTSVSAAQIPAEIENVVATENKRDI